jgi:predicted  nucleic acid-binding Zn-ribbon protein
MMGAAAYNRGSRLVSKEADERMSAVTLRVGRQAYKDEASRLREQIAALEHELRRARRCLAAERAGREALRVHLANEERSHAFGVDILCRLAFPGDES